MSVKVVVKLRKNLYLRKFMYAGGVESRGRIPFSQLMDELVARSSLTRGDVRAVVNAFMEQAKLALRNGQYVSIAGIGRLGISVHSKVEDVSENFTANSVKGFGITFKCNSDLLHRMQPGHENGVLLDVVRIKSNLPPVVPNQPGTHPGAQ